MIHGDTKVKKRRNEGNPVKNDSLVFSNIRVPGAGALLQ
jgi:hypothetical protein